MRFLSRVRAAWAAWCNPDGGDYQAARRKAADVNAKYERAYRKELTRITDAEVEAEYGRRMLLISHLDEGERQALARYGVETRDSVRMNLAHIRAAQKYGLMEGAEELMGVLPVKCRLGDGGRA